MALYINVTTAQIPMKISAKKMRPRAAWNTCQMTNMRMRARIMRMNVPISVPDSQPSIQVAQQPDWPNKQKLQVFEKRRLFAFDLMAYELADPGGHKDAHTNRQNGHARVCQ